MTTLLGGVALLLHAALMVAAAPLVTGLLRRLEARLLGRTGPPILQSWRDLARLWRKQPVRAESASWYAAIAPFAVAAPMLAASALVPSFTLGMTTAPFSDLILIAGLASASRCAAALAALDPGGAFGGIGASRAMTFAVFADPALLLLAFTLALLVGSTNLDTASALLSQGSLGLRVSLGLALLTTLILALAESGRVPVDNPTSHLELTMVDEATLLEYAGRDLALMQWAGNLRLVLWLALIIAIFLPFGIARDALAVTWWLPALVIWAVKLGILAALLALLETGVAKMRVFRVPEFLGVAVLLGLLAVVFLFVSQGFAT